MEPLRPALFARRFRNPLLLWHRRSILRAASLVISVEALREADLSPLPCRAMTDDTDPSTLHVLHFKLRRRTRVTKLIEAWSLRQAVHPSRIRLFHKGACLYAGGAASTFLGLSGERALLDAGESLGAPQIAEPLPLTLRDSDSMQLLVADTPHELDDVLMY